MQYETFRSANNKRSRDGKYQEINEAVYQWYCLARDAMVPINGPMIREEATEIAKRLNKPAEYDKKRIKNSQSLYDVLVRARQQLKNT